jgi:hypothetical protein
MFPFLLLGTSAAVAFAIVLGECLRHYRKAKQDAKNSAMGYVS